MNTCIAPPHSALGHVHSKVYSKAIYTTFDYTAIKDLCQFFLVFLCIFFPFCESVGQAFTWVKKNSRLSILFLNGGVFSITESL